MPASPAPASLMNSREVRGSLDAEKDVTKHDHAPVYTCSFVKMLPPVSLAILEGFSCFAMGMVITTLPEFPSVLLCIVGDLLLLTTL